MTDEYEAQVASTAIYKGQPKLPRPGEARRWRRFVSWLRHVAPWLGGKRELGEDFLEARVEEARAKARLTSAQATKALAEAEYIAIQTAKEAAELDERHATGGFEVLDADLIEIPDNDPVLLEQVEDLHKRVSFLRAKYGLRIRLLQPGRENTDQDE